MSGREDDIYRERERDREDVKITITFNWADSLSLDDVDLADDRRSTVCLRCSGSGEEDKPTERMIVAAAIIAIRVMITNKLQKLLRGGRQREGAVGAMLFWNERYVCLSEQPYSASLRVVVTKSEARSSGSESPDCFAREHTARRHTHTHSRPAEKTKQPAGRQQATVARRRRPTQRGFLCGRRPEASAACSKPAVAISVVFGVVDDTPSM